MLKTQSQLLEVLERFSTPHLQVVCDPYNYLSSHLLAAQDRATSELLARFEDRFVVAHLKDVDPGGVEVASPAFGTGVFNQQPYLEFLRDRRPDLPLVLEHLALDEIPQAMGSASRWTAPRRRNEAPKDTQGTGERRPLMGWQFDEVSPDTDVLRSAAPSIRSRGVMCAVQRGFRPLSRERGSRVGDTAWVVTSHAPS